MAPDAPHRDRPLRADPLTGSTDVLDRDAEGPSEADGADPDPDPDHDAAREAARRPAPELAPRGRIAALADRLRAGGSEAHPVAGRPADGFWARLGARAADAPVRQLAGGIALSSLGVGLLLGWVVHVSWTPLLDVGLLVIGAVLVVQARRSTPARPLIALGLVLAVISVATWRADVTLDGGLGRRREAPAISTAQPFRYQLGTGQLTVDLRHTVITGVPLVVDAEVGVGRIVVRVPADAVVTTRAVASGQVLVFGKRHVGAGYDETTTAANLSNKQIRLELRVGIGSVEVQRG